MWCNSTEENPYNDLPPPAECGWCRNESGGYVCDWECPEVQRRVTDTIQFLTKGCSCKKGCYTNQCSCRKKGNTCGPACQCQGCVNTGAAHRNDTMRDSNTVTESDSETSCDEDIQTEIATEPISEVTWNK